MLTMIVKILRLLTLDEGQNLVEYALVLSMLAFGSVATLGKLSTKEVKMFKNVASVLKSETISKSKKVS